MVRKSRKMLTAEMAAMIIRMAQNDNMKIKDIATSLDFNRQTIRKVLSDNRNGRTFVTANTKFK